MIRVLQVFGRMDRGGAEAVIMELYRHIDRTIIQFDFVVHTEEKCAYDDEIVSLGGRIFSIPSFNIKNSFQYKKKWNTLLSQHDEWRIVHGHVRSTASIYLKIAKKYGKYTIAHSHSTSSGNGLSAIIKNILQSRIKADYYFACSQAAGLWLFGKDVVKSNNFRVLPNAIDCAKFSFSDEIRKRVRKDLSCDDSYLVGHVGSFYDVKNHAFLLKVFESIKRVNTSAKLLLVGDGYLKGTIEESVKAMGFSDSVIFTGSRADVNYLLQAMDVFVFPSIYEGLGISAVEAQCSGVPIVISDRVPQEAIIINDIVTVLSLESSPDDWARVVLSKQTVKRFSRQKEIVNSGYDILSTSKKIEEFYLERNQI